MPHCRPVRRCGLFATFVARIGVCVLVTRIRIAKVPSSILLQTARRTYTRAGHQSIDLARTGGCGDVPVTGSAIRNLVTRNSLSVHSLGGAINHELRAEQFALSAARLLARRIPSIDSDALFSRCVQAPETIRAEFSKINNISTLRFVISKL